MNKKILIYILPIILIIIFIIIIGIANNYKSSKQLELTYKTNGGVPFKWEFEIEDPTIVEFKRSYVIRNDNKNGLVGGTILTNYVFVGKKEGVTKVTFRYVSITNEDYPPKEEVHTIKVDKDKNISLVVLKNE